MSRARWRGPGSGFSLTELLVVMAILLVIAAMAVPNVITAIADIRLRSSAQAVAGLLQQVRLKAVSDNRYYTARAGGSGTNRYGYLDSTGTGAADGSGNGSYDSREYLVQLSGTVNFAQSGNPSFDTTKYLGFTPITGDSPLRVSFNSRGLTCKASGTTCSTLNGGAPVGYLYFLTDIRATGGSGWQAVSVSPAGRIKVWVWAGGSSWQ